MSTDSIRRLQMTQHRLFFIKHHKIAILPILGAILTSILFLLSGCSHNIQPITRTGFYFDTVIQITLYDTEDESVLDGCFALAETYEHLFSASLEDSDIWNINHEGGKTVPVSEETVSLLEMSLEYAALTEGAVDPTIRPVSVLWHFGSDDEPRVPDSTDITEALSHVSYKNIQLTGKDTSESLSSGQSTVSLNDPDAAIDLGFIAKGYIADKIKEYLLSQNVHSACISLGGNVIVIGTKPDGRPFRIGIQEPFAPQGTSLGIVEIQDISVVTSGIYERCFYEDDVFYHHVLDTATGYPVDNELASVTLLCVSSTKADALSTSCLCLGLEKGRRFLDTFPDIEYLLITKDGTQYASDGFTLK